MNSFGELFDERLTDAIRAFAMIKPANSSEVKDDSKPTELENMVESASIEGKFDMRQRVGQLWARELKLDESLKTKYKECGKNYEAQRKFRTQWSLQKYQLVREERVKIVKQKSSDDTWGSYEPTAIIHEREGKDSAGARATLNYVKKCLQLHEKGYSYRNRPFVYWNSFTE